MHDVLVFSSLVLVRASYVVSRQVVSWVVFAYRPSKSPLSVEC